MLCCAALRCAVLCCVLFVRQNMCQVPGDELQVAYGSDGSPSKALLGFCKKNRVQASTVVTEADTRGTEYVWAVVKEPGRSAAEV